MADKSTVEPNGPKPEHTIFICLGGTGTQIGTAIEKVYPFLPEARMIHPKSTYTLFIMDKDTGHNYAHCTDIAKKYGEFSRYLPFDKCEIPYELKGNLYTELQAKAGWAGKDYTVRELIGTDAPMEELAGMCWNEAKRGESLKDGNNRDPSRGSLDAYAFLEHFEKSALFTVLEEAVTGETPDSYRLVILSGLTGGMGSSLIVPLVRKIKTYEKKEDNNTKLKLFEKLRIDLVLLGPYFKIPPNPNKENKVDEIGDTLDSHYRVKEQLKELKEDLISKFPEDEWIVYYSAVPVPCASTCGPFSKNGAERRKTHLLELMAALAAFQLRYQGPGFYGTEGELPEDVQQKDHAAYKVEWQHLPFSQNPISNNNNNLKKAVENFMSLFSIMVCQLYPRFYSGNDKVKQKNAAYIKKDVYLNKYLKEYRKNNGGNKVMDKIERLYSLIDKWLEQARPYFEFWNEIQTYSALNKEGSIYIDFLPKDGMEKLVSYFGKDKKSALSAWRYKDTKNRDHGSKKNYIPINIMPLCKDKKTWMNCVDGIKPKNSELKAALREDIEGESSDKLLLALMMKDMYRVIKEA